MSLNAFSAASRSPKSGQNCAILAGASLLLQMAEMLAGSGYELTAPRRQPGADWAEAREKREVARARRSVLVCMVANVWSWNESVVVGLGMRARVCWLKEEGGGKDAKSGCSVDWGGGREWTLER